MLLGHFDFTDKLRSICFSLETQVPCQGRPPIHFHLLNLQHQLGGYFSYSAHNWWACGMSICSRLSQVRIPQKNNVVTSLTKRSFNSSSLGGCPNLQAATPVVSGPNELLSTPPISEATSNAQQSHPPKYMPQKNLTSPGVRSTRRVCWRLRECGNKAVCLSPMKPTSLMWNQIPKSQLRLVLFTSGQPIPDSSPFLGKSGWLGNHSELAGRYGWNMRESKPLDCCSILLWCWNACRRIIASSYHSQPTILKSKLRDMTQLRFHICRYSEQRSSLGFTTPSKSKNLRYTQSRDLSMYRYVQYTNMKTNKMCQGSQRKLCNILSDFCSYICLQIRKHRTSLSSFVCFLFLLLCLPSPVFLCVVWS